MGGSSRDASGLYGATVNGPAGVYGYGGSARPGVFAESYYSNGVIATSWGGEARDNAALRARNFNTSSGMAGYFTNNSDFPTSLFANGGAGEVLYLQAKRRPLHSGGQQRRERHRVQGRLRRPRLRRRWVLHSRRRRGRAGGRVVELGARRCGRHRPRAAEPLPTGTHAQLALGGGGDLHEAGGDTGFARKGPPLAMTGTTRVKVTAEHGAIRPGGLLVSSSSPGRAMRAGRNPRVGTVLGKSLGALRRGTGTITMLVMLR